MSLVPDFLVTTVYLVLTLGLAEVTRRLCRFVAGSHPLLGTAAQEFIASFELCAVIYELSILLEYPWPFGLGIYSIYLTLATAWWTLSWEEATAAPYSAIVSYLYDGATLTSTLILIPCQLMGALIFYQFYIKPLWLLGFGDLHFEKATSESYCVSDIQARVFVAALIEGAGVFVLIITSNLLIARFGLNRMTSAVGAVVSTTIVVAAMSTTGGYFNPVLATALQFGCFGSTATEHFLVYWVAETVGAILAHNLWVRGLRGIVAPKSKSD